MPVQIRALSHIVLPVADLDAALAFYRDLLGLEVVMQGNPELGGSGGGLHGSIQIAALLVPGGTVIELVAGMQEPVAGSTLVALNVADLKAAEREVQAAGFRPTMAPSEVAPGITMMFLTDPDGRTVELVEFGNGARTNHENMTRTAGS